MTLPINPPFAPMEALSVLEIPSGDDWQYENRNGTAFVVRFFKG